MPQPALGVRRGFLCPHVATTCLTVALFSSCVGTQAAQPPARSDGEEYSETRKLKELGLPTALRNTMNVALMAQITELDRVCRLSSEQKNKLRLMGQGDIKHFFDLIRACKIDPENRGGTQVALPAMVQAGLFHDGSLFGKSISNTLNEKQLALRAPGFKEARRRRQEQVINQFLTVIESSLPFKPGEREQLAALLKEFPPPRTDGEVGLVYLAVQLSARAKKQPNKLTEVRLNWLTEVESFCKPLTPILRQAGYFPEEEENQPAGKR